MSVRRTVPHCRAHVFLRPIPASGRNAWISLAAIVVWHFVVLAAAWALVDWWLGFGAAIHGVPVPARFDFERVLHNVFHPIFGAILGAGLVVEGGLAWLGFWITTRRRSRGFATFGVLWWHTCIPATVLLPVVCVAIAAWLADFGSALRVPLLWFLLAPVGPSLLARLHGLHGFALGCCCRCGYDLTGNVSGVCPECGTAVGDDAGAGGGATGQK